MRALLIDSSQFRVVGEREITSFNRVEGIYIQTSEGLSPAAYYFPLDVKDKLVELMSQLAASKKHHDDLVAKVFYQELPKLRQPITEVK